MSWGGVGGTRVRERTSQKDVRIQAVRSTGTEPLLDVVPLFGGPPAVWIAALPASRWSIIAPHPPYRLTPCLQLPLPLPAPFVSLCSNPAHSRLTLLLFAPCPVALYLEPASRQTDVQDKSIALISGWRRWRQLPVSFPGVGNIQLSGIQTLGSDREA